MLYSSFRIAQLLYFCSSFFFRATGLKGTSEKPKQAWPHFFCWKKAGTNKKRTLLKARNSLKESCAARSTVEPACLCGEISACHSAGNDTNCYYMYLHLKRRDVLQDFGQSPQNSARTYPVRPRAPSRTSLPPPLEFRPGRGKLAVGEAIAISPSGAPPAQTRGSPVRPRRRCLRREGHCRQGSPRRPSGCQDRSRRASAGRAESASTVPPWVEIRNPVEVRVGNYWIKK